MFSRINRKAKQNRCLSLINLENTHSMTSTINQKETESLMIFILWKMNEKEKRKKSKPEEREKKNKG